MLLLLMRHYREFMHGQLHFYAWEDVAFRMVLGVLTSLIISLLWGPKIIRWLILKKVGDIPEFDHKDLNELTKNKTNTPTMGGLLILAGVLISTLLWADITNQFVIKGIFLIVWLAVLGGIDDWLKLTAKTKKRSRDGLRSWEKLVFQVGLSVLLAMFLYLVDFREIQDGRAIWLPFYKKGIDLGWIGFAIVTVLVITGSSNAVNLTDGMDGLATGCMGIASMVFAVLCYLASEPLSVSMNQTWASYLLLPQIRGAGELAIICASIFGACLGFLWFNCHPAQVFMGDVGSLPLGGLIGYAAVVTRHELLLLVVGGVFVMEAVSVIIQVTYYRSTGGKRIFLCAPIHHHFHLKGWSEPQVVVRFWLMGIACAAIALATLKLR
ncbi:MAG: phospho-N-acetylmuramoyl-pentapeptide-transferase [Sedimentisphaerales bacterium]|nr:phospho-N-acetylmuramoyl-pentapeptide-transferase [Sedimentisphaerales bacterium]